MNKKDLVTRVAEILKDNNQKKFVRSKKNTFYITDDNGNKAAFELTQEDRSVMYTAKDVQLVIDATLEAIEEAMRAGDAVRLAELGTFSLGIYRGKKFLRPDNGQPYDIPPKYVPKFHYAANMKLAAKVYELNHPITSEDLAKSEDATEEDEE